MNWEYRDEVAMDERHLKLIEGVAAALLPEKSLELGIGSGASMRAILRGNPRTKLTIVENFYDWGGNKQSFDLPDNVILVNYNERDFVHECQEKFDLIVSDADHDNSHRWWDQTLRALAPGGVAFFHDVTNPSYPRLRKMVDEIMEYSGMNCKVFSKSFEDRAWRGLLMVTNCEQEVGD